VKHLQSLTLRPDGGAFGASGTWDLLGRGCYHGASGPAYAVLPLVNFVVEVAA
jgi:hypothetical protein